MSWGYRIIEYIQNQGPALATRVAVALLIALGIQLAGRLIAAAIVRSIARRKAAKLAPVISSFVRVVAVVAAAFMALDHIGVDVTTLVAGAGVLGLAIGFGAQALVRDLISGFFLILDGALAPGDFVKINEAVGQVEEVSLRITKVRAIDGQLFYIPNGQVTIVGNFSREWCRAIVVVGVAYEQDVEKGLEVLRKVAKEWAAEHEDLVLEEPVAQGVVGLNSSDVTLRIMAKVKPAEHWGVERDLRARIKAAFDESNVEIPFPRQVVYHRQEEGVALRTDTSVDEKHLREQVEPSTS